MRATLQLVTLFALLFLGLALLESACYPWAHTLGLRPTLTGTWVGELTAPGHGKHLALVDLHGHITEEAGPDLDGAVTMCDAHGETHRFGLSGRTLNWRGTRFELATYMVENRDGEGVRLGHVDGEWDRANTWGITAKLALWRIRGGGTFSSTDRPPAQVALEDTPITFTMTRGSDGQFRAACDRLR